MIKLKETAYSSPEMAVLELEPQVLLADSKSGSHEGIGEEDWEEAMQNLLLTIFES